MWLNLHTLNFALESPGSDSELKTLSEMFARSAAWKTKSLPARSWSRILKAGGFVTRLFGPISKLLTQNLFAGLTSYRQVIPVSRSQSPESELEQTTRGTCGHSSETSLDLFGQEFASLKTSEVTFDWDCLKCLETSEALATELGREYSQRRKSARLTDESESLSWPTSQARDYFPPHNPEYIAQKKAQGHGMANLNDVVQLWPTASSRDYKDTPGMSLEGTNPDGSHRKRTDQLPRAVQLWMTPVANDDQKSPEAHMAMKARMKGGARKSITSLTVQVKAELWRTPSASDGQGGGNGYGESPERRTETENKTAGPCTRWPARPGEAQFPWEQPRTIGGKLNSAWVAQLMGLPSDWCEVPGLTREMKLRALGNAVVPQQAEFAIRTLMDSLTESATG